jgi:putative acetyltransferase
MAPPTEGGWVLRPAVPVDAPALWAVHTRAVRHLAAAHYTPAQVDAWSARTTPASYAEPIVAGCLVVAADPDGRVAGYGELAPDEGVIRAVYVDPDYARRGVGRALVQALEARAKDAGFAEVTLDASRNAVPFYQSLGYRSLAPSHHPLPHGVVLECEVMTRRLR